MSAGQLKDLELQFIQDSPAAHFVSDTLTSIGNAAWAAQLPWRTAQEIDRVYPPDSYHTKPSLHDTIDDINYANRLGWRMRQFGRGVIVVAVAPELKDLPIDQQVVGYAVLRNDVSGSPLKRFLKTYPRRQPPYAWLQSINVRPEFQGQGIGAALLRTAAEAFPSDQPSTAYVFDENPEALGYFARLGYAKTTEKPDPKTDYFGPDNEPVQQWRLLAPNIGDVALLAKQVIERNGLSVIDVSLSH